MKKDDLVYMAEKIIKDFEDFMAFSQQVVPGETTQKIQQTITSGFTGLMYEIKAKAEVLKNGMRDTEVLKILTQEEHRIINFAIFLGKISI
jgi:predicted polyphosphate/ATP-dependent NAD kinase